MKQTAVKWLVDKYIIVGGITKTMVEQAKEMEKEHIVDAFSDGTRMIDVNDEMSAMFNGVIYYGETYEQDKQG